MKTASISRVAFWSTIDRKTKPSSQDHLPMAAILHSRGTPFAAFSAPCSEPGRSRLRDLVAAYQASTSDTHKRLLIAQICPELQRRRQQKERAFYRRVQEALDASRRLPGV